MSARQVVVIGAGVVGAALADELSALGGHQVTVVDQGPVPATGGSSSHAPGLVFQTSPSKALTQMARYTVEKLGGLSADDRPCYLPVGGLEIATTPARLTELARRHGWATAWCLDARLLGPEQCLDQWPLLDPDVVLGGLHLPTDGLVKAVNAVQAQLERAQARGVRVMDRCRVLDIRLKGDAVVAVVTDQGEIAADVVISCAGIWGPRITAMVGLDLPLTPLAHQLAWTTAVPALRGAQTEATRPILRHQDGDLYYRERGDTLGIGYYGHRPMPIDAADIAAWAPGGPMPSVLAFTPDDFAPAWHETHRLLPGAAESELAEGINGLFSFTSDGMPLLGESPTVRGFWVAEAVWVTHSAGVGKAVAEWVANGYCSTYDLHEMDVNRFFEHQLAPQFVLERDCQSFVEVYDILHPLQPMQSPRPMRTSPFYVRQRELEAEFLEASGWERPQWYGANKPLLDDVALVGEHGVPAHNPWAERHWSPIVGAEARATRERVAAFDMTALHRLEVTGPGAAGFLQRLSTGDVDKSVGAVTYCLLLDRDGGIRSDVTIARLGRDHFQVGANGNLDLDWLQRNVTASDRVQVRDITGGTCCIGLWGPLAREVVQPLADVDLSATGLTYFRGTRAHLGTVPVTMLRLSYVGELGWEIYTSAEHGLRLWDTVWAAGEQHGLVAAGRGAFTSLRLEKGYRSFGTDMTFEHDPYEAGLGFAVKATKPQFLGRDAVLARKAEVTRRLVCLTGDDPAGVVMGKEPVYDGATCVGYVTSAGFGYTIGKAIAYAWVPAALAETGTALTIGYFDARLPFTVTAEPLFDPGMTRLRDLTGAPRS